MANISADWTTSKWKLNDSAKISCYVDSDLAGNEDIPVYEKEGFDWKISVKLLIIITK